jgi:phospholipid transport system substrate-binding protein
MRVLWIRTVLALATVFAALAPAAAADDPAAARITAFYATLTETMQQGGSLGVQGRYQKLAPAIDATFDTATMSQYAVGPRWTAMSQSDRDGIIAAFRRLTIADYAHNFASYDGQQFVVDPNVIVRGPDRVVQTKMIQGKGDPITFTYRMRQSGNDWKIVDVYLSGFVSELATRRSDFSATVTSGGAAALTKKLNSLADGLLK